MQEEMEHTVLIVDDDEIIGRALAHLIKHIGAASVYVSSGKEALQRIHAVEKPFSLIISDQQMPEMKGSVFLEQAKEITPDSIRFLITGYTDMKAVTEALNIGAIHQYISKPWDTRILTETIKAALEEHALIMENHRLFALAKKQNAKLYQMNVALKKKTDHHKKIIIEKNEKIAELTTQIDKAAENQNHMVQIEHILKRNQRLDQSDLNSLHTAMVGELSKQFADIAIQSGFEMPHNPESSR
ncbi:MAG: response regulator [Desulfobacteraceae bacterium]|nr:response regulator [Desulfobacteraceae bacterium]